MAKTRTSSASSCSSRSTARAAGRSTASSSRALRTRSATAASPAATALPSSRALAAQLGVSRGIVVEAYEQLVAEGYLASRPGGATRVARARSRPVRAASPDHPRPRVRLPTRPPGRRPSSRAPAWLRIAAARPRARAERPVRVPRRPRHPRAPDRARDVPQPGPRDRRRPGRRRHLHRVRAGARAGRAGARGRRRARIAVEDPSDPEYRRRSRAAGLELGRRPGRRVGLRVDLLEELDVDGVVVTAAHQYPTGAVLPPDRRAALVDWAARRDGTIVEDDYDAEFRYDREPIGAIQGLCPTGSSTPARRARSLPPACGWAGWSSPPSLTDALIAAKKAADLGSRPSTSWRSPTSSTGRARPPPAPHAADLPRPPRRPARGARPPPAPTCARSAPRPASTSSPGCPTTSTRHASSKRRPPAGIAIGALAARRIAPGPGGLIFGYGVDRRDGDRAGRPAAGRDRRALRARDREHVGDRDPPSGARPSRPPRPAHRPAAPRAHRRRRDPARSAAASLDRRHERLAR